MQYNYVAYTLRDGVIKGNLDADNEAEALKWTPSFRQDWG